MVDLRYFHKISILPGKVKSYGPSSPLENSTLVQTVMSRIRKSERLAEKAMEAAGDTRRSDHNQEDVSSKRSMVANNLEDKTSARESLNVDNKKNNSEHGQSRYGSKPDMCYKFLNPTHFDAFRPNQMFWTLLRNELIAMDDAQSQA
ncbi:hypothetical protein JTB14_004693 [Gonioctena quinquepunctata]|nr:hypothetical protein JTB14_004693 [Gonioctena quinquepunctata]